MHWLGHNRYDFRDDKSTRGKFSSRKCMASMYFVGFAAKERYCIGNLLLSGKQSIFRVLYTVDIARLQRLITLAFKNVRVYRKQRLSVTNDLTAERYFHGTEQTDETKSRQIFISIMLTTFFFLYSYPQTAIELPYKG